MVILSLEVNDYVSESRKNKFTEVGSSIVKTLPIDSYKHVRIRQSKYLTNNSGM